MAQPAWITYPQIEDLNSGRTTRDANTRLINNLTAMFGTTPNEFLTTSNVEFANVTATTFVGDGTGITGLAGITGGVENDGNTSIKADANNDSSGVITLQIFNTPAITINNNRTMIWNSSAITLDQDLNFITSGGVNGFSIDGTTFSVDGANNRVGILIAEPVKPFQVQSDFPFFMNRSDLVDKAWTFNLATSSGDLSIKARLDDGNQDITEAIITFGRGIGNVHVGGEGLTNLGPQNLAVDGGILALKLTTTPTADSGWGKIYTKTDNDVYFQDGAGTEKTLLAADEATYTVTAVTTTGSITLSEDTASYVKKGREVTVTGRVLVDSVSTVPSPTGTVNFLLPFAVAAETEGETQSVGTIRTNFNQSDSAAYLTSYTFAGQNIFVINELVDDMEPATIAASSVIAGDHFTFTLTYFTDL